MALVDRGSFYVEGYFEETKLAAIHLGDPVIGLADGREAATDRPRRERGGRHFRPRPQRRGRICCRTLIPTFNWVRLAQRIPVRVALDPLPDNVRLVAGQTATVQVLPAARRRRRS